MNLLKLMVEVGVDDKASASIDTLSSGLKSKLAVGAKAAAAALAAAGTAAMALGKQALDAYADFEQLEGGVDKLYGNAGKSRDQWIADSNKSYDEANAEWMRNEQAYTQMMTNAQQAYMTAGMSANQYMEQATSFSAALINSLGGDTQKAAELTDVAMRAMSDNVNTFGTDMQSVQMAFQGFSKQNYSMLDNLKLGYGGTKQEMERLIADANEYAASIGEASDMTIDSFADQVRAIDLIQQKQHIAGTTAREAATTIQGSLAMTTASWQNLLAEIGKDDGDVGARVTELVDSVANTASLIIPRISTILTNVAEALPLFIDELLPVLEEHSGQLIEALSKAIEALVPVLLEAAVLLFAAIAAALIKAIPGILESFGKMLLNILEQIVMAIKPAMNKMEEFMTGILKAIGSFFGAMWNAGAELVNNIIGGIAAIGYGIASTVGGLLDNAYQTIMNFGTYFYNAGVSILNGLIEGIASGFNAAVQTVASGLDTIRSYLPFSPAKQGPFSGKGWTFYSGKSMMEDLAEGIESTSRKAEDAMRDAMGGAAYAAHGELSLGLASDAETAGGGVLAELRALRDDIRNIKLAVNMDGKTTANILYPYIDQRMYQEAARAGAR